MPMTVHQIPERELGAADWFKDERRWRHRWRSVVHPLVRHDVAAVIRMRSIVPLRYIKERVRVHGQQRFYAESYGAYVAHMRKRYHARRIADVQERLS